MFAPLDVLPRPIPPESVSAIDKAVESLPTNSVYTMISFILTTIEVLVVSAPSNSMSNFNEPVSEYKTSTPSSRALPELPS